MTFRDRVAAFYDSLRNPAPTPREPAVDHELERRAKKVGKTIPQLHQLGISDAQIRELSTINLEQRVSRLELQMREQGICEPRTIFVEPPAKKRILSFVDVNGPDGDKIVDYE